MLNYKRWAEAHPTTLYIFLPSFAGITPSRFIGSALHQMVQEQFSAWAIQPVAPLAY